MTAETTPTPVTPEGGASPASSEGRKLRPVKYRARVSYHEVDGHPGTYRFYWREPRRERVSIAKSASHARQHTTRFSNSSSAQQWADLKAKDLARKYAGFVFNADVHP